MLFPLRPAHPFQLALVGIAASLLAACAGGRWDPAPLRVAARPVELVSGRPGLSRVGSLRLLKALVLRSTHPQFGGLSGIEIDHRGGRLWAVSDRGLWLTARLERDGAGILAGLRKWQIQPLRALDGAPVKGRLFDAECLVRDRDGSFLVGFEQVHRLWRYHPDLGAIPRPVPVPPELSGAPRNGGLEAVTVLPDGRLLLIAERHENADGSLKAWLGRDGRFVRLSYVPTEEFAPTDLATLPDGDVLVLERAYSPRAGVRARVGRIPARTLVQGSRLEPVELARLTPPMVVDNFEGIAVDGGGRGKETFVYLISDDNYSAQQQTLLFQLRLE